MAPKKKSMAKKKKAVGASPSQGERKVVRRAGRRRPVGQGRSRATKARHNAELRQLVASQKGGAWAVVEDGDDRVVPKGFFRK